ncbi:shikimate kinase [Pontibacter rugosus]|uniref:Shikimate kinase n=1 Tax=Pontibacter rugosus TaxID=1745966 RepID=A0ABW3SN34_9BACT
MLIFLIGMMGSGKTTLGRQLAQHLGYTFIDLDEYIVQQQGQSIAQIFEQQGQDYFRVLERKALEELVEQYEQAVISTGGGAPCFFDNIDFINQYGISIFLDVSINVLSSRLIAQGQEERPLLTGKSETDLISFLAKTLDYRKQFYDRATHVLQASEQCIERMVQLLNL